jgi:hypothetical protein
MNKQALLLALLILLLQSSSNAQFYSYRADANVTTDGNGFVTQWGNSNNPATNSLAQINANNRPRLVSNALNGKPAIEFDGNDILQSSSQIQLSSFTVFTVFNSTNTSLGIVYEHGQNTNTTEGSFLSTSNNSTVAVRRGGESVLNHVQNWAHDGQYRIVTHTFRSIQPRISFRINGVDLGLSATNNAVSATANQFLNIGARVGPTLGLQGRIAEIIFHNGELTLAQIDSVERALSAKYNIAVQPIPGEQLAYWLRADSGVDTTSAGRVTSWANSAQTVNPATQSNNTRRPRFIAQGLNGKPVVEFDGNDVLITTNNISLNEQTIFAVFNSTSSVSSIICEHSQNANTDNGSFLTTSVGSTLLFRRATFSSVGANYVENWGNDSAYRVITTWFASNDSVAMRINGNTVSLTKGGSTSGNANDKFYIGGRGTTADFGLVGRIAELIVYNRVLSQAERDTVEQYLSRKYNIPFPTSYSSARINSNGVQPFGSTGLSIGFSGVNTSGTVTVQRFNSPAQNVSFSDTPPINVSQYRYEITSVGLGFSQAELRFNRTQIPNAGITNANTVSVYRRPTPGTGAFSILPNAYNASFPDEVRATTTAFSEFILASDDNQLPVELTEFGFRKVDFGIELHWKTATELNNSGFEVQRRSENRGASAEWQVLGFVRGAGTTTEAQSYSFLDRTASGKVQYRLKQIDFDGQFEYSNIIEVDAGAPKQFALEQNYPNPFNPTTTISYQLPVASQVSLKVYDVLGREVMTLVNGKQEAGVYNLSLNGATLSSGIYFYRLQSGNFVQTKKMMLVK